MAKTLLKSLVKPVKIPKLTKAQKKPGHWAGKSWVWGNGKKTHVEFIRMSIRTKRRLPPGFYKACAESGDPGLIKMGNVAKSPKFKLKEMK